MHDKRLCHGYNYFCLQLLVLCVSMLLCNLCMLWLILQFVSTAVLRINNNVKRSLSRAIWARPFLVLSLLASYTSSPVPVLHVHKHGVSRVSGAYAPLYT